MPKLKLALVHAAMERISEAQCLRFGAPWQSLCDKSDAQGDCASEDMENITKHTQNC